MAQAYRATDSYLQEIGSGAIWQRLRKGDINWRRLPGIARAIARRAAARIGNRVWPIAARLLGIETQTARIGGILRQLSERGTDTLLVYSDTDPGREELALTSVRRDVGCGSRAFGSPRSRTQTTTSHRKTHAAPISTCSRIMWTARPALCLRSPRLSGPKSWRKPPDSGPLALPCIRPKDVLP